MSTWPPDYNEPETPSSSPSSAGRERLCRVWLWIRFGFVSLLLSICLGAYLIRTDLLYGLTIWPAWAVALPGLAISALVLRKTPWAMRAPLLAGWLLLPLGFSEEWRTV